MLTIIYLLCLLGRVLPTPKLVYGKGESSPDRCTIYLIDIRYTQYLSFNLYLNSRQESFYSLTWKRYVELRDFDVTRGCRSTYL